VLLDVVMNHTGPVTESIRVAGRLGAHGAAVHLQGCGQAPSSCTLVKNLPDFLTESDTPVELPNAWWPSGSAKGRFEREQCELNEFLPAPAIRVRRATT
jgi:alpha-amylase